MLKNVTQAKNSLIEQLKLQVGHISNRIEAQGQAVFGEGNVLSTDEITDLSVQFLELMVMLLDTENPLDSQQPAFRALKTFFGNISKQIVARGGRMEDFVRYMQFLQRCFIESLGQDEKVAPEEMRAILLLLSSVFNELLLAVFQTYLEEKERTIEAQQRELRETSTPITEIWDGVLTLPIIGTLDSSRTLLIMEALLNRIAQERASAVVMDVTGVHTVDSQVSHHMIQMVRAIQLMGATAILTGIRPEIARAMTSLNIDLGNVTTRATLSDGLKEAFRLLGVHVSRAA
ncbi:STAS domain-containing protein [Thiobacter aerophilum]|uniref:STAS domain-containing protein n=1 Tax=Thiobacter aerophilum TaxID=3121275 RepID=A0ABV0EFS1_9BURK